MNLARTAAALAKVLTGPQALVLPGAYDPLSAKLVEEAGFPAVYVGSYAAAAAGYGLPDVGALTLDEIARHTKAVADAVSVPVVADAEGGFFEPGNIWRTIDAFERAGVAAIHIEDHAGGKHTTLPQRLIPLEAMTQKLRAALDARCYSDLAIVARTDAIWATKNLDEAIVRLKAFEKVGVDYLFPTGATPEMLREIRKHVRTKIVTINLSGVPDPADWDGAADLVIDYGFCLRAATKALKTSLALAKQRKPEAFGPALLESEAEFEARLGYADFTRRAETYQ
jgi:methylisocitrate lyase